MSLPVWPAGVPSRPIADTMSRRPKPTIIAFGTETGSGKRRRRSQPRASLVSATIRMTPAERDAFVTFFQTTLADGASPFTLSDPWGGGTLTFVFDAADPWAEKPAGQTRWDISVKLERRGA